MVSIVRDFLSPSSFDQVCSEVDVEVSGTGSMSIEEGSDQDTIFPSDLDHRGAFSVNDAYGRASLAVKQVVNHDFNLHNSFEDGSVDLITVAQAFHWLTPHEKFFKEVDRLLKPERGVFVIVGYTRPFLVNNDLNEIWESFYFDQLGNYYCLLLYFSRI